MDITKTGVQKDRIDPFKKKQQDNYQTLLQALEMRANIITEEDPVETKMDWSKQGYSKKESTWVWEFSIEQDDIFRIEDDPTGTMLNDVNYVPFNQECNETAKFQTFYFSTKIKPINILFEFIDK